MKARLLLTFLSCAVNTSAGDLTLAIEPHWRGAELAAPSVSLRNDSGPTIRLTRVAALFSENVLPRRDDTQVWLDGRQGFFDAGSGRRNFTMRGVPEGVYVGLEFQVDVPSELNHADPGQCRRTIH